MDYATFLGGSQDEHTVAQTVDTLGNVYLTGTTNSPDFPLTSASFGIPSQTKACGFVTKLNPGATALVWSVCLANLTPTAIGIDSAGDVFVLAGNMVVKLSPTADRVVYTCSIAVFGAAIAVDAAGNAYVTGTANAGLATSAGAYQANPAPGMCAYGNPTAPLVPCNDAFVMKLTPDGSTAYATYLGGANSDAGRSVAVDAQGYAWITGDTESPNFPVTTGALQSAFHGEIDLGPLQYGDVFVAKLDPLGGKLLYSTYLGGSAADQGLAIAVDRSGSAYVAGYTQSADFPTTSGVVQPVYSGPANAIPGGPGNGFLTKFSASGVLVYSTFGPRLGTAAIAVDAQGDAYLPGTALTVLSPDATSILHSVPLSGDVAVDAQNFVYLVATTRGYTFFPTEGAVQPRFGEGVYDASIMRIDFTGPQSPWVSSIVNAAGLRSGTPQNYPVFEVAPGEIISIFGAGFDNTTRLLFDGIPAPVLFVQPDQMNVVVPFEVNPPVTSMILQSASATFGDGRMDVFDAVPALFTADHSGKGQAAVLNQDGSVNSPSNPAERGSVISVFLAGGGRMTPAQTDGTITSLTPPFPLLALGASCNVGEVIFAGAAPGLIAGAGQVNVRISQDIDSGSAVPIVIYVGNFASGFTGDTTIAVK
ncbi:MAG TPA: SBBP repeat-containing protein [Candidatus Limnocylindrales bacterium]|nr:SBBP repeat-containing protein [Candidatus Limnocylindrales bacterium]